MAIFGRNKKLQKEINSLKSDIVKITNLTRDTDLLEQIADTDLYLSNAKSGDPKDLHNLFNKTVEISIPILYIAKSIAKLPINEVNKNTGRIVKDSKYVKLLNRPNQYQKSRFELIKSMIVNNLVSDCYINRVGMSGLMPSKLFVLDPTVTTPVFSKEKDIRLREILRYETKFPDTNEKTSIEASDVYHMTDEASTYNDLMKGGRSVVAYLVEVLSALDQNYKTAQETAKGRKTIISEKNNPNSPGFDETEINSVLQSGEKQKSTFNPAREIEKKLYKKYGYGGTSRGNIAYLNKEVAAQQLGFSPEQLGIYKFNEDYFLKCCMATGVDPLIVGYPKASTYNNKTEAARQYWEITGMQVAGNIASSLSEICGLENTEFQFDYSEIEALKNNKKEMFEMSVETFDRGLATGNEVREAAGMPQETDYENTKPQDNETENE